MVQRLGLRAPAAGVMGSILGQGRSCRPHGVAKKQNSETCLLPLIAADQFFPKCASFVMPSTVYVSALIILLRSLKFERRI